jgi:hypothetical protein
MVIWRASSCGCMSSTLPIGTLGLIIGGACVLNIGRADTVPLAFLVLLTVPRMLRDSWLSVFSIKEAKLSYFSCKS